MPSIVIIFSRKQPLTIRPEQYTISANHFGIIFKQEKISEI